MDWSILFKLLTVFNIFQLCQSSYVQHAKLRIRQEVGGIINSAARQYSAEFKAHNYEHFHKSTGRRVQRVHGGHRNRWSSGHRKSMEHHHFTGWSAWSMCSDECVKRRERYCKLKRKCGLTKHVEERKCLHCHPTFEWDQRAHKNSFHEQQQQQQQTINHAGSPPQAIIINAAAVAPSSSPTMHVLPTEQPTAPALHDTTVQHDIRLPMRQENAELYHHHHDHQHDHRHYHREHENDDDDLEYDDRNEGEDDHHQHEYYEPEFQHIDNDDLSATALPMPPNSIENSNHYDYDEPDDDYYVFKTNSYYKNQKQKQRQRQQMTVLPELDEYSDSGNYNQYDGSITHENIGSGVFGPIFPHSVRGSHGRRTKQPTQHQQQQLKLLRKSPQALRVPRTRNLSPSNAPDEGIEGDTFQYEDFDFDPTVPAAGDGANGDTTNYGYGRQKYESQPSDSYEDNDYDDVVLSRNTSTLLGHSKEKATPDALIPRHRRLYSKWSRWTKCSPKCTARRYKKCRVREQCGREVLREITYCYTEGSFCQQWLQAQMQKSSPYELRPLAASRRHDISVDGGGVGGGTQSNSIVSDYIMNSKGYRGPEYAPMKLKCGIAPMRNGKRSMYNMLKIIGGKASRKGEWPWQVAIFNRFKEAFCGGTLIAPQWILTAAHCVRKILYVRLGEHNLDYEDGTEMQLRVSKSFKHPNFDKKTVDSDVALLKLPKSINTTTWIGFSCLPRPYQPLPKNLDCTVIGWGKRRNRDAAGTSVLHQAEVPIISMDNCRSVYQDYTITKNMFCAGHKRGRVDTCAGDSGGPLLCRDTTKPNHPWTIFGITSFGDGCAKRNKFGIYAKVPNYVDWVWSVINCNGNCKLHQRNFG